MKHDSRAARKSRRTQVLAAVVAIALGVLLALQAMRDIMEGDCVMGENYMGQPVGPGLQLIGCLVALAAGAVLAWQYFHPKPQPREKKSRSEPCNFRWPHEIP